MLIVHANLVTWENPNRILMGYALLVQNGRIVDLGPEVTMAEKYPGEERLDAQGHYVMPGSICAHTHFYGAFSRGMAIPGEPPQDFPDILHKLWWPLDKSLDLEGVRYSALVCMIDAIRHGTTTLFDHHASPNAIDGSLDVIAQALDETGLRAVLCYEITDRDGEDRAQAGLRENLRFIDKITKSTSSDHLVGGMIGLHASLTLSDRTLERCREAAPEETGFHIHVAEHEADEYDSLAKSGMRVVDRLAKQGILGPRSIIAHAVHVDAREIQLLVESGAWVTHQPRSNMNNGVGLPPVESMLRAGVKVCLGNDGFSNAMWDEWKCAYLAHKLWNRDPRRMNGLNVVKMAVEDNGALSSLFFHEKIGVIENGAAADLIFVDYHPVSPLTAENIPWHILFGFDESMITTTMVAGRLLMHNRALITLDEERISARACELAGETWKRYQEHFA